MHKLTFYPLGNADCCLIDLRCGKKILFDYGGQGSRDDASDKRIDLGSTLRKDMKAAKKDAYEAVAFTHLDDDHTHGAEDFFYFDHASKYQGSDRLKINCIWVPAAVITESCNELEHSACVVQAEARHRLKMGYGIRVFSRPAALREWLEGQGLTLESRSQFITDAGNVAPEFTLQQDGVEFFVHSPFGWRQDDSTVIDRNRDSLVMQAQFEVNAHQTKALLGSDVDYSVLTDMVKTTKRHGREYRLEWDVFKLPHHCSYKTLGSDRGEDKTTPVEEVKWLFEDQGQRGSYIVSPSWAIPKKGTVEDESTQPPHRQAANYYRDVMKDKDGEFLVTMEHPNEKNPEQIEIEITGWGARLRKTQAVGVAAITGTSAPRAG